MLFLLFATCGQQKQQFYCYRLNSASTLSTILQTNLILDSRENLISTFLFYYLPLLWPSSNNYTVIGFTRLIKIDTEMPPGFSFNAKTIDKYIYGLFFATLWPAKQNFAVTGYAQPMNSFCIRIFQRIIDKQICCFVISHFCGKPAIVSLLQGFSQLIENLTSSRSPRPWTSFCKINK